MCLARQGEVSLYGHVLLMTQWPHGQELQPGSVQLDSSKVRDSIY